MKKSTYYCSCKICNKRFDKKYWVVSSFSEKYVKYKSNKQLINHVITEHKDYLKEKGISERQLKKENNKKFKYLILFLLADIFLEIPIFLISVPLYLLYLGLEKLFDKIGHLW